MPTYATSLFIFRRDLRLQDNTGLNQALHHSKQVIPCFIFDPRQIEPHTYQSEPGLHFMLQCIDDLKRQLSEAGGKLSLHRALPQEVIKQLLEQHRIEAVFVNRDYTPFSRQRDADLAEICSRLGIAFHVVPDALLIEPEQGIKSDGTPYKVFTAFFKHARTFPVTKPQALTKQNFSRSVSAPLKEQIKVSRNERRAITPGGRQHSIILIDNLSRFSDYEHNRNYPHLDATSKLSAHLKYGSCSIREVYYAIIEQLGKEHPLLRQLYWRDFFTHIAYHFPEVFGHAFLKKFDHLVWNNNPEYFQAWCKGKTGFPIVDAGMRELNATGFMQNRVRMITASFLVKNLQIDWRWGERYFAQQLTDYDPCVNNGNWQWVASTGCDAQPYFRIFNPWTQQQKFDPNCRYIYRWVPELSEFTAELIHQWHKRQFTCSYPAPIVDHVLTSRKSKERYKIAAQLNFE